MQHCLQVDSSGSHSCTCCQQQDNVRRASTHLAVQSAATKMQSGSKHAASRHSTRLSDMNQACVCTTLTETQAIQCNNAGPGSAIVQGKRTRMVLPRARPDNSQGPRNQRPGPKARGAVCSASLPAKHRPHTPARARKQIGQHPLPRQCPDCLPQGSEYPWLALWSKPMASENRQTPYRGELGRQAWHFCPRTDTMWADHIYYKRLRPRGTSP